MDFIAGLAGKALKKAAESIIEEAIFGPSQPKPPLGQRPLPNLSLEEWNAVSRRREQFESYRQKWKKEAESSTSKRETGPFPEALKPVYEELKLKKGEMRAVLLTPGTIDDPLDFKMKVIDTDKVWYDALSWRWDDEWIKEMTINGVQLNNIPKNLYDALRYIRAGLTAPCYIWFDTLCLNQGDGDELGREVMRMDDVYSYAREVLVWLGKSKEGESALAHFASIEEPLRMQTLMDRWSLDKDMWEKFGDGILESPWWGRAWMVQEMACAHSLAFICGPVKVDHTVFSKLMEFTYSSGRSFATTLLRTSPTLHFKWQTFEAMYYARTLKQKRMAPTHIAAWLYKFRYWESTDPSDRVYAYLGLAKNCPIRKVKGKPWSQLYKETTIHVLRDTKYTDFICLGRGPTRDKDLPSWVPDLRQEFAGMEATPPLWCGWGPQVYNASNGTPYDGDPNAEVGLFIGYRVISKVDKLSILHDHKWDCIEDSRRLAFGDSPWRPYQGTAESSEQALGRTLVWDLGYNYERCRYGQGFFEDEMTRVPNDFVYSNTDANNKLHAYKVQVNDSRDRYRIGRKFVVLANGFYAMVPPGTQKDDIILILSGASVPMVFRPNDRILVKGWNVYSLIGECYVHGVMDGIVYGPDGEWAKGQSRCLII